MADNVPITAGTGTNIATDDITTLNGGGQAAGTSQAQRVKVGFGDDGIFRDVSASFPLPIFDPDAVQVGTISATDAVVTAPAGDGTMRTGASTAGSTVVLSCPGGDAAWIIQLTGTFGGGTVYFEESVDSTTGADGNWVAVNGRQTGVVNTLLASGVTATGFYRGNTSGAKYLRVRIVGATTPSVAAVLRISAGTGGVFLNASIPAGLNNIGNVGLAVSPTPVTTTMQAAVVAVAPGTSLVVTGFGTAVLQVSGTFVASVAFEASVDAGTTWTAISATQVGSGDIFSVTTVPGLFRITTTGIDLIRARVSAFTSGAITVVGRATNAINASKVVKLATSGNVVGRTLPTASDLAVSVTAAASTALTATLPAPAAGLFHYITSIEIQRYAAAALTGAAAPVVVTTTNLPGTLAWSFDTAAAIGTSQIQAFTFASPVKSSAAATATTFVAPLFTGAIWRITITYYTGV